MRARPLALTLALAALAGCGSPASTTITSTTLTVYTGLPLRGERAADGRAVLRGEKLALQEAGGRVGGLTVNLQALDDTDPATGRWSAAQVAADARQAAQNPTAIAYVGDLESGATAVALPITNEIGILHVAPAGDATGLTGRDGPGEPDRYYPSGRRNFGRLVAPGARQARSVATLLARGGVRRLALAYDGAADGLGRGRELERALGDAGVELTDLVRVDPGAGAAETATAARDLARSGAAVLFAGTAAGTAARLLRAVHRRAPAGALYAGPGVAGPALTAGLGGAAPAVTQIGPPTAGGEQTPEARRMAARYERLFGRPPPAAALYGYEAMRTILGAISRAAPHGNDRRAVITAWFATRERRSVLGPYAVTASGDISAGDLRTLPRDTIRLRTAG